MSPTYANNRIVNSEFGIASSSYTNLGDDESTTAVLGGLSSTLGGGGGTGATSASSRQRLNSRIKSVDTLRGVSLAFMVFANAGSGGYTSLSHAVWDGLHLADLLFPCFVFVMGVAVPLSLRSLSARSIDRMTGQRSLNVTRLLSKAFVRSVMLFLFGLIISNGSSTANYITHLRIMGVLQRFAIVYIVCMLVELVYFRMNNFVYVGLVPNQDVVASWELSRWILIKSKFKEIFLYPLQWLFVVLLALVWMLITFLLPVEGCPTGYLGSIQ